MPSVKGEIAVWANSNKETPCSTSGPTDADVTVKFPALKPFDSKLVTATVTVPSTPGDYTLQILYDSTCANNINSDLAHTSVDYQVLGSPEPDYGLLNIYGSGVDKSEAFCSPARPVVNQTFEVTLTIKNFGSGVYDSSTPVLKVYPGIWFGESDPTGSPPEQQPVTDVQPATIQLPKIKPGKTFVAKATLTVPEAGLWKLDAILEINEVQFKNFDLFYGVTPEPLPYFMPVYQPGTVGYKVGAGGQGEAAVAKRQQHDQDQPSAAAAAVCAVAAAHALAANVAQPQTVRPNPTRVQVSTSPAKIKTGPDAKVA